jgi:protease I
MKALFLVADGFEDMQFFCAYHRLRELGAGITIAAANDHKAAHGSHGYTAEPDMPIPELNPAEYDILIIPGGRSPEQLRLREEAVDLTRTFMQDGTLIAAIGHGPQLLISAGILAGKNATCAPAIRDDVRCADGLYRDEDLVVDGNLITARGNDEIYLFCESIVEQLSSRETSR